MKIRIVADVHGKIDKYIDLVKNCDYSIQLGDMGFDYSLLKQLDSDRHKFIAGNHDNYDTLSDVDNWLGLWGKYKINHFEFFFVGGGFSIDKENRIKREKLGYGKSYWENEELSYNQLNLAINEYEKMKPDFMFSHEAPRSIVNNFTNPDILRNYGYDDSFSTRTGQALEVMFQIHQPKIWFFGHYHSNWSKMINGTQFVLLNELSYCDLEV